MQKLSELGIECLRFEEGLELEPYRDKAGYLTIGYGHKLLPGETFNKLTEEQAELLFQQDIQKRELDIDKKMKIPLTQNQYDALFIFIYNIGGPGFFKSNVYKHLKLGDLHTCFLYWKKWNKVTKVVFEPETEEQKVKKVISRGLVARRAREVNLFKNPLTTLEKYKSYKE